MTIKAIFFDAAGTLIKPSRPVGQSYAVIAEKYGMSISPADINERFRICFAASPPLAFSALSADPVEQLERQWWRQVVRQVFAPWDRFERFDEYFAELFSYFAQPGAWTLYTEVNETLAALKNRGLLLAVISNFDSRLIGILDGLGVAHWFEDIFISSRIGHAKPAREIFQAALARHTLAPHEAMHVGDSEECDLRGAGNAGVKGILIDRTLNLSQQEFVRIKNLGEILSLLDSD
ncbi:MAG: HAD-IA family hydrolase [Methylocella sp.]